MLLRALYECHVHTRVIFVVVQFGLGEIRSRFWELSAGSKDFAKRQTMWGTMFSMISGGPSRDEGLASFLMNVLLRFLFNLLIAMVVAVVWFAGGVYWIIAGMVCVRAPSCVLCGRSCVLLWMFCMYVCACVGGGVCKCVRATCSCVSESAKSWRFMLSMRTVRGCD